MPSSPVSEVLPRMIQGDAIFDPLSLQLLDRYFICERGMPHTFLNGFCDRFAELLFLPDRPPLVVHLNKLQIFPFTVRCLFFSPTALSTARRKFVLLTTEIDETATRSFFMPFDVDPSAFPHANLTYLLNHPLLAHWYSTNGNIRHPKFTALPIGFPFYHQAGGLTPVHLPLPTGVAENHELKRLDEKRHSTHTRLFLKDLQWERLFPHRNQSTLPPLRWGSMTTMWLERALEVFVGLSVKPPVKIIPLDQLPERITTFYVVLMPIEKYKRRNRPSLTSHVIIFEEPNKANHHRTASAQHIGLMPYTVALYYRLSQNLYAASNSAKPKVLASFSVWEPRKPWLEWLEKHATDGASSSSSNSNSPLTPTSTPGNPPSPASLRSADPLDTAPAVHRSTTVAVTEGASLRRELREENLTAAPPIPASHKLPDGLSMSNHSYQNTVTNSSSNNSSSTAATTQKTAADRMECDRINRLKEEESTQELHYLAEQEHLFATQEMAVGEETAVTGGSGGFAVFPHHRDDQSVFYSAARHFTFVASPPGKGYDCFRTWEALTLGAIPIVQNPMSILDPSKDPHPFSVAGNPAEFEAFDKLLKPLETEKGESGVASVAAIVGLRRSFATPATALADYPRLAIHPKGMIEPFRDLPVIFVDHPEQITEEHLKSWRDEIYRKAQRGDYKLEKLFMQFWIDKIYGHDD